AAELDHRYYLFATAQAQVDCLRLPLGVLPQARVRELASEMGLAIAAKQDSQDICFVPMGRYTDVIARLRPEARTPGDIVHVDGRVLGRHEGVVHFTVGQRRGLGIAAAEPLFVVRIDAMEARVVVGPREALETRLVHLRDFNWLGDIDVGAIPEGGIDVHARLRSTRPPRPARLLVRDGGFVVEIADGEIGVAPGQACVLYADGGDQARVLGGGFISHGRHRADIEAMLARLDTATAGTV